MVTDMLKQKEILFTPRSDMYMYMCVHVCICGCENVCMYVCMYVGNAAEYGYRYAQAERDTIHAKV
jgi:hypothetical protein